MPVLAALLILVQISVAVHAIKTRRPLYWLFIIFAFPALGCAAYFFAEIVPELRHSRTVHHAARGVQRVIDPDKALRQLTDQLQEADTVDNKRALAAEYLRRGMATQAVQLYESTLQGIYADDADLMMGLARAQFMAGAFGACVETLDRLKTIHPSFESADGHLLYARALEGANRVQEAMDEYRALVAYFPGEEAKCRYALLLAVCGYGGEARTLFQGIVRSVEKAKRFYRDRQREWYDIARQNLNS